mmetsp:Transcript_8840/g.13607  ORF Transcript_8840/g.13607 Transcript_8840/m.13607 type:complete len:411 (-) Transcript_8840:108-1340(-)
MTSQHPASVPPSFAFFALGVLNNTPFVLLLACAKSISEGGTALIFLSNSLPSLLIKLTAPYWFDRVSYQSRILCAAWLMALSFFIVATFSGNNNNNNNILILQLMGVAMASAQGGMGEASLLALAGKFDVGGRKTCLTAFSSGTGVAGIFGFLWKFIWNEWLQLSLRITVYLAIFLAFGYGFVYWNYLRDATEIIGYDNLPEHEDEITTTESSSPNISSVKIDTMTTWQRFQRVLSLWPYMIPLFLVYAAEYSLQAGIWTAIGFPLEDMHARAKFYEYSNWMYQVGVFLSRSSGTIYTAPMSILWLMPILQCINVVVFWEIAKHQFWYNNLLLLPAFYVGLLGGGVYINGYSRICLDIPPEYREFALSSTSLAESLGVVAAEVVGLYLQACLYQIHDIDGAMVSCPVHNP